MANQQTWLEILSLCDEFEKLVANAHAWPDPPTLTRAQALCYRMTGHDTYINEKAAKLARTAATYFSARKHAAHPRGAEGVMQEMRYALLGRIRDQCNMRLQAKPG